MCSRRRQLTLSQDDIDAILCYDEDQDDSDIDPDYVPEELSPDMPRDEELQAVASVAPSAVSVIPSISNDQFFKKDELPNKRNVTQRNRLEGISYTNEQGKNVSSKQMGPACTSQLCRSSSLRECSIITEEERLQLFHFFWQMKSWDERKAFLCALVSKVDVKQKKAKDESRRSGTFKYSLKVNSGNRINVCKTLFASTFAVDERTIGNWVNKGMSYATANKNKTPKSGKTTPISDKDNEFLKNWLEGLPTVPSHYCRRVQSYAEKKFLFPGTQISSLHAEYSNTALMSGCRPVGLTLFKYKFHALNFSVFIPRKDQCDICLSAKHGNITKQLHDVHLSMKEKARTEKARDKEMANTHISVWTMDLQAVLTCPRTKAGSLYYRQKLQVHNLTFYDLSTHKGYCFAWDETEGDLSSETFASIQYAHFTKVISENPAIKTLIIWSDGCNYQNRNCTISNMYLYFAISQKIEIQQKFLIRGHTQMECDSMHSVIERQIVGDIYTPRDYIVIMQCARKKPVPYEVKSLEYNHFFKLSQKYCESIRPGKKTGDPTVYDIRSLRYTLESGIQFKLSFGEHITWDQLPQRITIPQEITWKQLHSSKLSIKKNKYDDLQSMKPVLPKTCHDFYDKLPVRLP